jgi:murein DD-endopeptidase MepM/ murein hydrolase activator NlpD
MKGSLITAAGMAALSLALLTTPRASAAVQSACQDANLRGAPLAICSAYVQKDCPTPENHPRAQCVALRSAFAKVSGGQDLDEVLSPDSAQGTIPSGGGTVTLPGIGSVTFPPGAFPDGGRAKVAVGVDAGVAANFEEFASIFRPSSRLAYEVTVSTGSAPPISDTVDIALELPADFRAQVPDGYGIELFAMVEQESDLDLPFRMFELFESHLDQAGTTITATVPTGVFFLDADGEYKTVITLAPTPGVKDPPGVLMNSALVQLGSSTLSTSQCKAASISCPVAGGCTVTSPYQPARKHPVTGQTRPHYGVDYRAPTGTVLTAAASGTIERSYSSSSFGETIIIRHDDGGATLYAHLQRRDVQNGARVTQGQQIGTANNTGLSSGPHLHMEYVPNGQIIQSKSRIDPDACMDAQGSGSVTVSDSGSLADDAFGVAIDGFSIGQTAIGASNTLAISNLKVGQHTLTLTVLTAPDNVGTYTVQLNDGLRFTDGSTSKSGSAPQGATLNWAFVVP